MCLGCAKWSGLPAGVFLNSFWNPQGKASAVQQEGLSATKIVGYALSR